MNILMIPSEIMRHFFIQPLQEIFRAHAKSNRQWNELSFSSDCLSYIVGIDVRPFGL